MRSKTVILGVLLFLLLTFSNNSVTILAETEIQSQPLELTVYIDGFVKVDHTILLNQSTFSINVSLLGESRQNIIIVEENGLPIDYSITGNNVTIYTLGASRVSISYLTPDLTTKIGKYWTIKIDLPENRKLVLPENSSIISISVVPDLIETSLGHLTLTLPSGSNEITYTVEPVIDSQTQITHRTDFFEQGQLIIIILSIALTATLVMIAIWLKNKNKTKPQQKVKEQSEVDVEKLLSKHRELRQDEIQVIHFLASKGGKALEAELFEFLALPRTTTWRLIRRLEGMEIINIKKSRRQNTVLIREKYLKNQKRPQKNKV